MDRNTPVTYGDINDAITAILGAQLIMVAVGLLVLLVTRSRRKKENKR